MSLLDVKSLITGTNPYYINPQNSGKPLFERSFKLPSLSSTSLHDICRNSFSTNNNNFGLGKRTTSNGLGNSIADTAKSYRGYKESDGSYLKFGEKGAWCVAFSTYVTKESLKKNGISAPSWLNTHSVAQLMKNADENNCFLSTKTSSDKASLIANNVKPGDTVIFKTGRSHAGIVTKVYSDGSFDTVEGNTSGGKVATRHYSAYEKTLNGFVQVA